MLTMLLVTLCFGAGDRSDVVVRTVIVKDHELFAKEDWYRGQDGEEQDFFGILEVIRRDKSVAGFGRFNPYRLVRQPGVQPQPVAQLPVLEVYVGGKDELLAPFVGKRVRITGKRVDMEVEGREHHEIWPASLRVLAEGKATKPDKAGRELNIIATAPWPHVTADPDGPREGKQLVARGPEELRNMHPWNRLEAPDIVVQKMATDEIAKLLKVPGIDWKKEMLVIVTAGVKPTGGWKVEIGSLKVEDGKLAIHWSVTPPRGAATQAFTHPALVAMVERFEGPTEYVLTTERKILPRDK